MYYFGRFGIWLYGCMKKYMVNKNQLLPDTRFERKIKSLKTNTLRLTKKDVDGVE